MVLGSKLLIVFRILFTASPCVIFLTFLAAVYIIFYSHLREALELAFVNFQFYLVTFYVRTCIQVGSS